MKKTLMCIVILLIFCLHIPSNASALSSDTDSLYNNQLEESGAKEIIDALPKESKDALDEMGISQFDSDGIKSLSIEGFINSILNVATKVFKSEGVPVMALLGIILLCALANGLKSSLSSTQEMIDIVGTLFICAAISVPIVGLVENTGEIIRSSSDFMLIYLPVMVGLMISSGQSVSGGSYYTLMMTVGQCVSQICSRVILPLVNIFLGMSIVSSISKGISINGICNLFNKSIKWILGFIMGIFTSLLTIQGIIGSISDSTSSRAVKFAIKSFIPVVGGALSDAYLSVQGCIRLLKSGVGIVAMIGNAFIYLPMLFKCLFWLAVLNICCAAGEIFDLKSQCALFDASAKTLSTLIAILLCCMAVFIISTAVILMVGGAS